jgi:hypothetical protein
MNKTKPTKPTKVVTDKSYDKYVNKAIKTINSGNFNNPKDIEGISNMYAMDMAKDFKGPMGKDYQTALKKYKVVILKKVSSKL